MYQRKTHVILRDTIGFTNYANHLNILCLLDQVADGKGNVQNVAGLKYIKRGGIKVISNLGILKTISTIQRKKLLKDTTLKKRLEKIGKP